MCIARVFGAVVLINSAIFCQIPAPPQYEVSSIKPNSDSDSRSAFRIEPDGTLYATGITLRRLMMTAYNVQGFRFVGGPGWASVKRWDVQAKPSRAAVGTKEIRPMLRALLEDRFQLHVHSETRNMPIYELTVDPKGPKLHRADSKTKLDIRTGNGLIRFSRATVATFASQLSYALARPVIDKTGISGEFSFALEWNPFPGEDGGPTTSGISPAPPDQRASNPGGPSIFTAIDEQLGLRLKSGRGRVEVLVVDRAQLPAAN